MSNTGNGRRAYVLVKRFEPLRQSSSASLEVQIFETHRGRKLDIREHVSADAFEGFTRRGIALTADEFAVLLQHAEEIGALLAGEATRSTEAAARL
jgi:hypothetical protein